MCDSTLKSGNVPVRPVNIRDAHNSTIAPGTMSEREGRPRTCGRASAAQNDREWSGSERGETLAGLDDESCVDAVGGGHGRPLGDGDQHGVDHLVDDRRLES
jgi:hypothetical protein